MLFGKVFQIGTSDPVLALKAAQKVYPFFTLVLLHFSLTLYSRSRSNSHSHSHSHSHSLKWTNKNTHLSLLSKSEILIFWFCYSCGDVVGIDVNMGCPVNSSLNPKIISLNDDNISELLWREDTSDWKSEISFFVGYQNKQFIDLLK
jgi:hypothetical protein